MYEKFRTFCTIKYIKVYEIHIKFFEGQSTYFITQITTIRTLKYGSFFVTVRMAFIHSLNGITFILTGELAVIYCLSNSFCSRYYNYFLEYSQASIPCTILLYINGTVHFSDVKFAAIQFNKRAFFKCISKYQSL